MQLLKCGKNENMDKLELRQQASISILNSLLETTQHSVLESLTIKDVYAKVAVLYADALVNALDKKPDELEKWCKDELKFSFSKIKENIKAEL